jgi:two-component system OmpR family response regulator/two-component system response regulator RstA
MELWFFMNNLVIIEDDKRLAKLIGSYFARSGFDVSFFEDGYNAIQHCKKHPPDIIILDLNLPDLDGITVCAELRKFYDGNILILTASGNDFDQIDGFETGADDFVTKPVEPRVLLARIKSLLKRNNHNNTNFKSYQFGNLYIDTLSRTVKLNNALIKLTSHEFELLYLFIINAGTILSRDKLYTSLKGIGYDGMDRAIDIKISRLRKKLGDNASEPTRIKTIWGKGYLFVPNAWE